MTSDQPLSLGRVMRALRARNDWTLKEMSEKSGIPISTLSKVEHDRLTLTYDKLQQISERLDVRMADLFVSDRAPLPAATGRRSIGTLDTALRVTTPNYDYYYLCAELRHKRMIPNVAKIRAKTLAQFGNLVRHAGEEFVYVISGNIIVHTEFYDPVTLSVGESIYIDSGMGHAYLLGDGCEEAIIVAVMSSDDADLMRSLLHIHHERTDRNTSD